MLHPDSPFLRPPADLPRDRVLFADALRLSAQMAGSSFQKLKRLLISLVNADGPRNLNEMAVEGIGYAYGVIDVATLGMMVEPHARPA